MRRRKGLGDGDGRDEEEEDGAAAPNLDWERGARCGVGVGAITTGCDIDRGCTGDIDLSSAGDIALGCTGDLHCGGGGGLVPSSSSSSFASRAHSSVATPLPGRARPIALANALCLAGL